MKPKVHKIVPALVMGAATAVPIATTAEILTHVTASASGAGATTAAAPVVATPASKPTGTPPPTGPATTAKAAATARPTRTPAIHTYTGSVVYDQYGGVQATVTVKGKKITNVSISAPENDPRSASINSQVVPMLQSETLQAQSANVNVISGATETSQAYAQSLQAALKSAGLA